jgi:hypothetical protein
VAYSQIAEVRTAPRAFGLWGDCVIFLKNGDRLVSKLPAGLVAAALGPEDHHLVPFHIASCPQHNPQKLS